jgi:hypothetical protein
MLTLLGGPPRQIAIVVEDLDRALPLYAGPGEEGRFSIFTFGPESFGHYTAGGRPATARMRVGINGATPQIELIQPLGGGGLYEDHVARHGHGLHHVGYYVEAVPAAIRAMEAAGYPLLLEGGGHGADGDGAFAYFDTQDALGYVVEAITPPAVRGEPEATYP